MYKGSKELAAFALYKNLYSSEKYRSPSQIVAEYIAYVLRSYRMHSFGLEEMKGKLNAEFGFDLPGAVIKTSIKNLDYVTRKNRSYSVNYPSLKISKIFEDEYEKSKAEADAILLNLSNYAEKEYGLSEEETEELRKTFLDYMLEDRHSELHSEIISRFIIKHSGESAFRDAVNKIRIGCILHSGIMYTVEAKNTNVFPNDMIFYLDTEILLDLAGYNGEAYRRLAQDFLNLVKETNEKGGKIGLRYFILNRNEIDELFYSAECQMQENNVRIETTALTSILNGCDDVSDIVTKKADFFSLIRSRYGIECEKKTEYYKSREDVENNLERMSFNEIISGRYPTDALEKSCKYLSHTNKHRGKPIPNRLEGSRAIFITRTRSTLYLAKEIAIEQNEENGNYVVPLGKSLEYMTNYLWNRLNKGFGSQDFPLTMDVVIKAQIILSGYIDNGILKAYEKSKQEYEDKTINEEVLIGRIITLREKPHKPEQLTPDSIDDALDFGDEMLDKVVEDKNIALIRAEKSEIRAQELEKELQKEREKRKEEEKKKFATIEQQKSEIKRKNDEINLYREADEKRMKRSKRILFVFTVIIEAIGLISCISLCYILTRKMPDIISNISNIGGTIALIILPFPIFRWTYKKFFINK